MYQIPALPSAMLGGQIAVVGAGTTIYNTYLNYYNNLVSNTSPIELDIALELNNDGQLAIFADAELTEDLSTTDNYLVFLLTYRFSNDYFCTVASYDLQEFNLTNNGETGSFEQAVELAEDWDLGNVTAVVLVQSHDNYPVSSGQYTLQANPILQAAKTTYTGVLPMFRANITEGPSSLGVQFTNLSFPQEGIESFEWDFDGDGEFELSLEDPYYLFSEPGQYDVTLRIQVAGEYSETTVENYITVTDGSSISGDVAGFWSSAVESYTIEDDIIIPEGAELAIGPGANIILNNGSRIVAEGRLAADGSQGDRIVFSSDNGWEGIEFSGNQSNNIIRNCSFNGAVNTVITIDYDSDVDILDNIFHNNTCTNNTATSIDITSSDNVNINRNIFASNAHASQTGGIICTGSSPVISNNLFVNNGGENALAGAFIFRSGSAPYLLNNTISHNQGNNLMFIYNSDPVFMNSIIQHEGNMAQLISGSLEITYSCVTGGYDGEGNIIDDPLFESPAGGHGPEFDGLEAEWYLTEASPCIDAGNPDEQYNDNEDPENPGNPLYPALGTLTNDMGAFGGDGLAEYTDSDDQFIPQNVTGSKISVYPNPFNPTANIFLQLNEQDLNSPVTLEIFNIKGQLVKKILDNEIVTVDRFSWNGKDNFDSDVTSGVYLIKMLTATSLVTHKLLLIK